ncbi:DUF2093 domain-containing protein [Allosphingosinicella flava]|uniref:DUF2093 domain-containing protein n=1 Tax=Allosphingosinicella flava TaxID=2771430 RepID=A0A7T2GIY4_9SPHN|nr:DUF2093 domain-containing protein [Sphingosinicella flava]QPQ54710.1 DUF2093 domain-containing protein [Sphingosinicella flava]
MLMSPTGRAAKVHYLDGTFRLLSAGDHVLCAVTSAKIPLDALRYWNVARQEAYVSAETSCRANCDTSIQSDHSL